MMPLLQEMVVLAAVLANCVVSDTPLCLALAEGATSVRISSRFTPIFSLFTPAGAAVAFLFAVYATAVGLPVQSKCFRDPDPFRPALTEIPVEKGNAILPGHRLTNAPDEIVLLKAAVKKGRRKGFETAAFRDLCRLYEPQTVAMPAAILLTECDLSQEPFHGVTLLPHDAESLLTSIDSERIEAPFVFQIGMNVRIVKVAADLMAFHSEDPQGIDGAWSTTDMQQYVQSQFTNPLLCAGASHEPPAVKKILPGLPRSTFF
jgi:hypothetical protein